MSDHPRANRFTHKVSRYERPTGDFRCGRASMWGKPCSLGPDANGKCGGIAECRPFKNGDRWECRRLGGACADGPRPDGTCCNTQPPCAPTPSNRRMRGRVAKLAFVLSLAALALAAVLNEQGRSDPNAIPQATAEESALIEDGAAESADAAEQTNLVSTEQSSFFGSNTTLFSPGDLSDIHLAFTGEQGCNECHVVSADHGADGDSNSLALASLSAHEDLQEGCVRCHAFGGPTDAPHNQADLGEGLQCQSCHTEHKGRFAELVQISNQQCAQCHEQKFTSFKDHVAFGERFPHRSAGGIVFDHAKHLNFHFDKAKDPSTVPTACTSCHIAEGAKRKVKIGGFDQSCAGCHESNIVASAKSDLALLELPKLKIKQDVDLAAFEQCGAEIGKRFKAAGKGRSTPFQDWLLGAKPKEVSEYSKAFCELLQNLGDENMDALLGSVKTKAEFANASLFAGLSPEVLAQLASTWVENERYRPIKNKLPKGVSEFGWFVDSKGTLKYRPTTHGDPVAMAWIDFAQELKNQNADSKDEQAKLAVRFADGVLSDDGGLGACLKCHVPDTQDVDSTVADPRELWAAKDLAPHHRFKFNHSAHLSFVGAGSSALNSTDTGCAVCHQLNPDSTYADTVRLADSAEYNSNFNALNNETCAQCHNENSIKDDCTLCHQYHEAPAFTQRLSATLGGNYASNDDESEEP